VLGVEPEIKSSYVEAGLVRLVFNPVINHGDRSLQSHQAAECAGDQGQFWAFRQFLFTNQNVIWQGDVQETLKFMADTFGLDSASFNACLDEQRYFELVFRQDELRLMRGILVQPTFDINGQVFIGAQKFEVFEGIIESQLADRFSEAHGGVPDGGGR
jgi:protein-disulfide isomerase